MFDVVITPSAELDIQENYRWWYVNRSQEQAIRWYVALYNSIENLRDVSDRCPLASEAESLETPIRQLSFGLGRLPSHRVIFVIADQQVVVLRVRHVSQSDLTRNDLL